METASLQPRRRLTVEQYRDQVLALIDPRRWPSSERVGLAAALGRVLAEDVVAREAVPRFANSAMDGFGVAHAPDLADAPWTVVGEIPAGRGPGPAVGRRDAVRIMTGAPIPAGVDTVIPLEDARTDGDQVWFTSARPGQHIRPAGEDVRRGDRVVTAGTVLAARHLAAAASVGLESVTVAVAPRVAVVTTGDELAAPGEPLGPAAIPDANGPYLVAALAAAGVRCVDDRLCRDTPDDLAAALDRAAGVADLILVTGGVSVGDRDVTRDLLLGTSPGSSPRPASGATADPGPHQPPLPTPHPASRSPDGSREHPAVTSASRPAAEATDPDPDGLGRDAAASVSRTTDGDHDGLGRASVAAASRATDGDFVTVAMQPGKPQGLGRWSGVPVLALPGNPVSVAVSFVCFVRPLVDALLGRAARPHRWAEVDQGWRSPPGRRQFMPVAVDATADGRLAVRPATAGGSGSHLIASLARADAVAVVAEAVDAVRPGDVVELLTLDE